MALSDSDVREVNYNTTANDSVISAISDSGIYITGLVNHCLTCVLLDTGATVSVLSEDMWKKSGYVSKLGSDFFQQYGCQIHYDTGTFVVGDAEIPIRYCKVTPSVCRLYLCAEVEVEPGTEQVLGARLEEGYEQNTGSPGILEGSKELKGKSEICIARSLVVPRAGQALVRVANFSDRPIKIRSDVPIAEYHPISSVNGSIISIGVDSESKSNSRPHASCSTIDSTVGKSEQTKGEGEKWRTICEQQNLEGLSEGQKEQFSSLVKEYEDIFAMNSSDLGKSDLMEHEINTGDCTPIKQPPRRIPPHQREIIDQQLDELVANGRVEQSQSPWSSPVVLARKHDGTYRMCIDFRRLFNSSWTISMEGYAIWFDKWASKLHQIDESGTQWTHLDTLPCVLR